MPINPIMNGGINAPIEGDDESGMRGFQYATRAALDKSLGWTGISLAKGYLAGGPTVSQKDAEDTLKGQGYDASGIPAEGMTQGALQERMTRQSDIHQSEDIARRAHLGTASQVAAGIAASVGDPINVALAPALALAPAIRGGLAVRAAVGAVEGGAIVGAYETGQNVLGKYEGDPDISSHQMMRDMMFGSVLGGVMHSAFGPRPISPPNGGPVTLDMIDRLGERTANFSKATGVPVDQVVSRAGAMGRYQVEPATAAEMMGLDGKNPATIAAMRMRLRDPEFNKEMAQKYLDKLNGMFPKDPEAVAIAYNAGPGAARKFIRAGRDYSVLPEETRGYAARVAGMPRNVRVDGAKVATAQAELDSKIDVKPIIDASMQDTYRTNPAKIAAEHDAEVSQIESDAFQRAVPKQDTALLDGDTRVKSLLEELDAGADFQHTVLEEPANENKSAIDPELSDHVTNDVADAEGFHDRVGGFEPKTLTMADFTTKNAKGEMEHNQIESGEKFRNAVEGAVANGHKVMATIDGKKYELTFADGKVRDMKGNPFGVTGTLLGEGNKVEFMPPKEAVPFEAPEPLKIDGLSADEHQKAVEAAVRCGTVKGGFE